MPLLILSIIIQVCFVVHVVKTGRDTTWIWIIVMLPLAGSIAYLILEVLPSLSNTKSGRKARSKVQSAVNPNKDLNNALKNYSSAGTIQNSMDLANECLTKGMYQEASDLYQKCLVGPYADDPTLILGLAKAQFGLKQFEAVKQTLDKLIELHPDYKNQNAHLLYARTLASLNDVSGARHEFETLHQYFTGPEASYYFALFLKQVGEDAQAKRILNEIVQKAKQSGRAYQELHKEVLRLVKRESAE